MQLKLTDRMAYHILFGVMAMTFGGYFIQFGDNIVEQIIGVCIVSFVFLMLIVVNKPLRERLSSESVKEMKN